MTGQVGQLGQVSQEITNLTSNKSMQRKMNNSKSVNQHDQLKGWWSSGQVGLVGKEITNF